jgi:potassium efflux system protein
MMTNISRASWLGLLFLAILPTRAASEDAPALENPVATVAELTTDDVQTRLKRIEADTDLEAAIKSRLVETYNDVIASLNEAADSAARAEQYRKRVEEAPALLKSLTTELAGAAPAPAEIAGDAGLAQLQPLLSQAETKLTETATSLKGFHDEPKRRADRRIEIPKRLDAARQQIADLERQLAMKPPADELPELTTALRMSLEARRKALTAEMGAAQQELQYYEATADVLPAQRDLAARRAAVAEQSVKSLRTAVNDRRRAEAAEQARESMRAAVHAHPAIKQVADGNAALANERQELAAKIEKTDRDLDETKQTIRTLNRQFEKITTRIEKTGETDAIGLMLRKQRALLPNTGIVAARIRHRADEISGTYLKVIEYEEQRDQLATLDTKTRELLVQLGNTGAEETQQDREQEIRGMLQTQRGFLDSLISDTNSYLDKLVELDTEDQQLIAKSKEHAAFCDERILWIRSATVMGSSHLEQIAETTIATAESGHWPQFGKAVWQDIQDHPIVVAIAALILLIFVKIRPQMVDRLKDLSDEAGRTYSTSILPTVRAFVITVFLGALWPVVMALAGWRLSQMDPQFELARAAGHGLMAAAAVFATLELFRQICRQHGLGDSHFNWPVASIRHMRRSLRWLLVISLPMIAIVNAAETLPGDVATNSLGRAAFLICMAAVCVCAHLLTRPGGQVTTALIARNPKGITARFQKLLHLIAVAIPVSLGVLDFTGYYYTALEFAWRGLASLWLLMGLIVVHASLTRWVLLAYRDLAIRRAREKRAAEAAASASPIPAAPAPALEIKLADINANTRKLIQLAVYATLAVGLWLIWADVLPALGVLRRVTLWEIESLAPSGGAPAVLQQITLADLILASLVVVITVSMSRNIPSFLEITLLKRLPIDAGARYAVSTICRYVITATGIVMAFETIGVGWAKVQWLVAAISVGLGFGLQEIFANFISGLMLLFERPIRPGDIVTVGDVTGSITRIQMRATTITDWDMRELIVPNKEFITGRVMNWTLSTTVSRMSISVGVAYGTDPDLVRRILLQAARQHPLVLNDPPPHALFDDFGPSSLTFTLRVYMASRDVYLQLRHELMSELVRNFDAADVEIAFPQLDIHVRSEQPQLKRAAS